MSKIDNLLLWFLLLTIIMISTTTQYNSTQAKHKILKNIYKTKNNKNQMDISA